jgi:hypothetical protein
VSGATNSQYVPTKDLPANSVVYWRVRGKISSTKYTSWSQVGSFTTANPPSMPALSAPANNALVIGPSPLFDWKDSTVPSGVTFDHYQIQIATDSAFTAIVHDHNISGVTNSQDNDALLNPPFTYYWRVRSFAANGDYSAWSLVRSVKIKYNAPVLNQPGNGATGVSLLPIFTWNATLGAGDYTIQVSKVSSFSSMVINKTATAPIYTATTSLSAGTTYYWRVRINSPLPSDWSLVFSFTTQ